MPSPPDLLRRASPLASQRELSDSYRDSWLSPLDDMVLGPTLQAENMTLSYLKGEAEFGVTVFVKDRDKVCCGFFCVCLVLGFFVVQNQLKTRVQSVGFWGRMCP